MESLNRKYENFKKCYAALGKSINTQHELEALSLDLNNPLIQNLPETVIAGVVKHFELTYETAWKFLKEYLYVMHNREILLQKQFFALVKN